jgi:hypothetical protein
MKHKKVILIFATLAVVAITVGLAGAQSLSFLPLLSTSDDYHACVNSSTGAMRMIVEGITCNANEQMISWNQQGPQGPPGADADLGRVMQANHGNVMTKSIELNPETDLRNLVEVPNFGPISGGCQNGVSTVTFTIPHGTPTRYRRVWTTIDGGAPVISFGYKNDPEPLVAYGSDMPGAHSTTFRAASWDGFEEWLTTIEVDIAPHTSPGLNGYCTYRILATTARSYPAVE